MGCCGAGQVPPTPLLYVGESLLLNIPPKKIRYKVREWMETSKEIEKSHKFNFDGTDRQQYPNTNLKCSFPVRYQLGMPTSSSPPR